MQVMTGEGKSIIIAMLAVFVVKFLKKKVHVLENNEGLLERDFATYAPFLSGFSIATGGSSLPAKGSTPTLTSVTV